MSSTDDNPTVAAYRALAGFPEVMTVDEVASALRFSAQAIRAMAASGGLRAHKIGREWRFLKDDVAALLGATSYPDSPLA